MPPWHRAAMQGETISVRAVSDERGSAWAVVFAAIGIAGLLAMMLALNWHGFRGRGGDDWQYLDAARCVRAHLVCLPETHWAARYAIVYPLAAFTALFGENHAAVSLPALLATAIVVAALFAAMLRFSGPQAAFFVGAALVLTPVFADRATRPNADMIELAWVALAAWLLIRSRGTRTGFLLASGLCAGLAFGVRATAFVPVSMLAAGWLLLAPPEKRRLGSLVTWGLASALPLCAEMALHGYLHGKPLLRWTLELGHTGVPSTALRPEMWGASPFFNPALIAAWPLRDGPDIHWSVNGLVNLFFSPAIALTLIAAIGSQLLVLLLPDIRRPRWTPLLMAGALLHFAVLVYGLGIDPTPRMFLPGLVLLCVVLGVNVSALWGKRAPMLAAFLLLLFVVRGATVQYAALDLMAFDRAATRMIAGADTPLAAGLNTRRMLELNTAAQHIPLATRSSTAILTFADQGCAAQAAGLSSGGRNAIVLDSTPLTKADPPPVAWMRARRILLAPQKPVELCIIGLSPRQT